MTNPSAQTATLSDLGAMLRGMTPRLDAETYRFCSITSDAEVAALWGESLSLFREDEGATLILREAVAAQHGLSPFTPDAPDCPGGVLCLRGRRTNRSSGFGAG